MDYHQNQNGGEKPLSKSKARPWFLFNGDSSNRSENNSNSSRYTSSSAGIDIPVLSGPEPDSLSMGSSPYTDYGHQAGSMPPSPPLFLHSNDDDFSAQAHDEVLNNISEIHNSYYVPVRSTSIGQENKDKNSSITSTSAANSYSTTTTKKPKKRKQPRKAWEWHYRSFLSKIHSSPNNNHSTTSAKELRTRSGSATSTNETDSSTTHYSSRSMFKSRFLSRRTESKKKIASANSNNSLDEVMHHGILKGTPESYDSTHTHKSHYYQKQIAQAKIAQHQYCEELKTSNDIIGRSASCIAFQRTNSSGQMIKPPSLAKDILTAPNTPITFHHDSQSHQQQQKEKSDDTMQNLSKSLPGNTDNISLNPLDTTLKRGETKIRSRTSSSSSSSNKQHSSYHNNYHNNNKIDVSQDRRQFTMFHSSNEYGKDSSSAYLGEDRSVHNRFLFSAKGGMMHGGTEPLPTFNNNYTNMIHEMDDSDSTYKFEEKYSNSQMMSETMLSSGLNHSFPKSMSYGSGPQFSLPPVTESNINNYHQFDLGPPPMISKFPSMIGRRPDPHLHHRHHHKNQQQVLFPFAGLENGLNEDDEPNDEQLVAPYILNMCPFQALKMLEYHDDEITEGQYYSRSYPFGKINLGYARVAQIGVGGSSEEDYRWNDVSFVVRQNYLLEYDSFDNDASTALGMIANTGKPRGYAHLQHSTIIACNEFPDAFELHLLYPIEYHQQRNEKASNGTANISSGYEYSKRMLLVRVESREQRDKWVDILQSAANLKLEDLYDFRSKTDEFQDGEVNKDESWILGYGRYSTVYAARKKELHKQNPSNLEYYEGELSTNDPPKKPNRALKVIQKKVFMDRVRKRKERVDTLIRESAIQASLTANANLLRYDPSFVRFHGFFETREFIALETELLEGTDLFQYMNNKNEGIAEDEAALIMRDLLRCLATMERLGIAHRDVKPANILMCNSMFDNVRSHNSNNSLHSLHSLPSIETQQHPNNHHFNPPSGGGGVRVKLADYGMSAFCGIDGLVRGRCGTPGYVAPEVLKCAKNSGYRNKVDVFSAGVTLYVLLCGYEPFYGESDDELVEANKIAEFEFPEEDWASVSSEARELIRLMMDPDPLMRISADEALEHPWFYDFNVHNQSQSTSRGQSQNIQNDAPACSIS